MELKNETAVDQSQFNYENDKAQFEPFILDSFGVEIGFFFVLTLGCMCFLLDQVNGKVFRLKIFLMNRDFKLFQREGLIQIVNYVLNLLCWVFFLMPFIAIAVWTTGLLIKSQNFDKSYAGGISVCLTCVALFCYTYGIFKIKWNSYRLTTPNALVLILGQICFIAYQFVVILSERSNEDFFGYSEIFLSLNCYIVIFIIFLNTGIDAASLNSILKELPHGQPRDPKRDDNFDKEIKQERRNMEYVPTYEDVIDLFTIQNVNKKQIKSSFGGGIQQFFNKMQPKRKKMTSLFLWILAGGVLVAYAFTIYYFMNGSCLGFVTMTAVLSTDVILYLIYKSNIIQSATMLSLTAFINRFFLFIFGGQYWIYGYMILYIYYGIMLIKVIGEKRFPFADAYNEINLDNISQRVHQVDISRVPEFLLGIITVLYVVLFVLLVAISPDQNRVPTPSLFVGDTEFNFYMIGIFTIILVFSIFSIYSTYRLFIRKKKGIQPAIFYYIQTKRFDMYWIFISISYFFMIIYSLIAYWSTKIISYLVVGVFVCLTIILFFNAYLHFTMNDYRFLQDVKSINVKIKRHNKRTKDLKDKVIQLSKDIQEGKIEAIGGAENAGLAQKLMNTRKEEKQMKKEIKKQQTNANVAGQGPSIINSAFGSSQNFNSLSRSKQTITFKNRAAISPSHELQLSNQGSSVQPMRDSQFQSLVIPATKNQPTHKPNQQSTVRSGKESVGESAEALVKEELDKMDYEGGENEQMPLDATISNHGESLNNTVLLNKLRDEDSDDSEAEFDPDQTSDQQSNQKLIKEVQDWRQQANFISAFFSGKLRRNDYQVIGSILLALVSLGLLAFLVSIKEDSLIGITIAIPFVHYGMAFFSLARSISTDAKMSCFEYFLFFFAYCIQYGWGIFNLFWLYDIKDMDPSDPGAAPAGSFIVVYLIVIPFITSIVSAILKWIDDKGKFTAMFVIQISITFIQGVGMLVCAYVFLTVVPGIIISVIIVILGYIVLQVWIYIKNDYYLPVAWQIVNGIIILFIVVGCFVASLIIEEFANFFGFSISTWILAFFILLYSYSELSTDIMNVEKNPVYFSPWIFPVYIYIPKKNDIDPHNGPATALVIGYLLLLCWSVLCTVWVKPYNIGVGLGIIFEFALIITVLYVCSVTQFQMKHVQQYIDNFLIRQAWVDAKEGYIYGRNAPNREQLLTYEKMKGRRDHFRNYLRIKEGRNRLNLDDMIEEVVLINKDEIDIEWIDENMVDLSSFNSCYSYLYDIERQLEKIYIQELELMIQFQLLIMQQAKNLQEQERKYLFRFLSEKKTALFALGISINIPEEGTLTVRYARVITQIQKLSPEKQTMFNSLRDQFIIEERKNEEQIKERERIEKQKQKERLEQMQEMSDQKRKLLETINENMSIEELPDCDIKYNKILEAGKTQNLLYTDKDFGPNDKSLGDTCLNRGITKWKRASEIPDAFLFKDQINHEDVVQGALGDCYFLSAISVLGEKYVKQIITTESEEEWRSCGAFRVKFFKDGYEEIIIIDDFFPAYDNDMWVFVKGGQEGKELWPMVLEKAYAKMYGSYSYIEAGKVQYALSDLTDGFPEQIDLKNEGSNIQILWEKMKILKKHGCLMGAGSPEHPQGDSAINEEGIVQGHAYAVLDVQEVDNNRLVQLRNPHGATGSEWKGDWSDDDVSKWTERMKNRLKFSEKNDGMFWMDVLDFIEQYSYLYICRILGDGWKEMRVQGEWRGPSAEGLPTKTNPNARLDFNPQYEITITRPCDGFISLMQMDRENMFRGKHSMFFMVAKVGGKRITKVDKNTMLCRSGAPINLNIITSECDFDKSVRYPYKFTLLIANAEHGETGEGKFESLIYATDPNIVVKELPLPADMPQM